MHEGRIKLIQVIADSSMGGGPKHVLGILSNIDQKVFEPFLVCPPGYLSAEAKLIKGVEVYNFKPRSKFDLIAMFKLRSIIHKIMAQNNPFGPTIVHSHGPRAYLMSNFASPPTVKRVYTEHRWDDDYHLKNSFNEFIQKRILKNQFDKAHMVIAVSSSVKKYLLKTGMVSKDRLIVIPNGINSVNSKPLTVNGHKSPILGNIGNLNMQKGHSYLIDAMPEILKKYPLATLEIIGEGEERKPLEDQIKKIQLQRHVSLLGYRNHTEKYLRHWSVFVLSSVAETFGIVVLEAMKAGVPIVAAKVGGVEDIIIQNKNGILVKPRDPKAIARGVLDLLDNHALMAKFRREGPKRAKDFDWEKVILQLESAYTELFNR